MSEKTKKNAGYQPQIKPAEETKGYQPQEKPSSSQLPPPTGGTNVTPPPSEAQSKQ